MFNKSTNLKQTFIFIQSYKQPKPTANKIFNTAIENINDLYPSEESLIERGNWIWKIFMKKSTKASDYAEPTNKHILSILSKYKYTFEVEIDFVWQL